ncbi:secretoglobin family 1D member 2-like [Phyllostomus discolor]|uniref:Uteroglobin n=1 Tax=Phyllostomus discolor TaxID=89673 RepID=A0A7E6E2E3_9CHIR|nr:secretoglobin family 1D member 2-like [Phyllostomus discolor]
MRLSLCVLLITLALCSYEANATVCPAVMYELRSFVLDPVSLYSRYLLKFLPPREAVETAVKVKQCNDLMPRQDRQKIFNVVEDVVSQCNS